MPTVIYDGECAFCRQSVERLKRRDKAGIFEFVPWQTEGLTDRHPQLRGADIEEGMRLVEPDGSVYVGADAVHRIARELPRWRRFAWVYRLPGAQWTARRVYDWIAARRHRLGKTCRHGACEVDGEPPRPRSEPPRPRSEPPRPRSEPPRPRSEPPRPRSEPPRPRGG